MINFKFYCLNIFKILWGLGLGPWGLGIGDWGMGVWGLGGVARAQPHPPPTPTPQATKK